MGGNMLTAFILPTAVAVIITLVFAIINFTMSVTGHSLGCSVVVLFDHVGGGIYTKAAYMGADLVGKTKAGISEDARLRIIKRPRK